MVKRAFSVTPTGVQRFEDRFPGSRHRLDDYVPKIAEWRNNLTALSATQNLYLVAYGPEIYVFKPLFPSQALPHPVLIVPSRPSTPNLRGHFNPRQPNGINNLLVSHLGSEEVVAVVRDDGDVDIFLIRHISHAIRARLGADEDENQSNIADAIRPVFQCNVGASTWGLAIHSRARVVAVSSNAHEITVFRFGLIIAQDDPSHFVQDRSLDVQSSAINGQANIPCIAFCNTEDDLDARWLVTTDIDGICRTLDLRNMKFTQCFRFGRPMHGFVGGGYDRLNAGWTVAFLDRRSFACETTFHNAIGLEEDEPLPDARDNPNTWDLSRTIRRLPNVSNAFVEHGPWSSRAATQTAQQHVQTATDRQRDVFRHFVVGTDTSSDVDRMESFIADESTSVMSDSAESSVDSAVMDVADDLDDLEYEGTEDTTPPSAYYDGQRICGNVPYYTNAPIRCDLPPCPILHASVRNIYLLQPGKDQNGYPHHFPFVGMAAPLKQQVQLDRVALNYFERLNMSAYLPDLGVIVLASQKGRAIVLALTKLARSVKLPKGMESFAAQTCYGFRAESILPTARQEEQNLRPFAPLHGIAAAPVQGISASPTRRKRWRLMLLYQDHTMLSYELSRAADCSIETLSQVVV